MTTGQKAYWMAIVLIIFVIVLIIVRPITSADIEIKVDEYEVTTMVSDGNTTDTTEIERLLWWHPMQSLDEPNYYSFNGYFIDWNDLTVPSSINTWQAESLLRGELKGYGEYFVKAENEYGVNAVFLIALARHESGNGTYSLMEYNNIFSFGAFDDNIYQAVKFDSVEQCIDVVSKYIKDEYLTKSGKWFNGYSIEDVNVRYARDKEWANKIRGMFD